MNRKCAGARFTEVPALSNVRRLMRRHAVAFVCLLAALAIGVAATVDRHMKRARGNRADVAEWYCVHGGTRCGGQSSSRIESRWNDREWVYAVSFALVAGFGAVRLLPGRSTNRGRT